MILGIDIGTGFTKAVVFKENQLAWRHRVATEANPDQAVDTILRTLQGETGYSDDDVEAIIMTGWGQDKASLAHTSEPLLKCIARGALWNDASCRSVLCLGAQQSTVLSLNDAGRVSGFWMNDKCASGAGMFLEIICEALGCGVNESSAIAKASDKNLNMSSQCAVFAESEVVSLVNDGQSVSNIMKAILVALSKNIATLCKKNNQKGSFVIGGGLANNSLIIDLIGRALNTDLKVFGPEPDYIAAIGAALSVNGRKS